MSVPRVLRQLVRQPTVPVAVVLTLGLAVATNTALFSVFDGLLFRPLPYRDADRLVYISLDRAARLSLSRGDLRGVVERAAATSSIEGRGDAGPASLFDPTGAAVAEWQIRPATISPSAFDLLGVHPIKGRPFAEQDRHDPRFAVLLGYELWKSRFGADPGIVGRSIDIPGAAPDSRWRVVGVMPEGFSFPDGANFWIPDYPFYPLPEVQRYARLAPGVTVAALGAELPGLTITPLRERVQPRGARALAVVLVSTGLLLAVALVQVAGLVLAQTAGRITEIGVRLALGATRLQLVAQFVLEGTVVAILALGFAVAATPAVTSLIVRALPPEITLGQHLDPDTRAFAFAAVLSAFSLLVLTFLPVDLVRRSSPLSLLQGRLAGDARLRAGRARGLLFVGQLTIVSMLVYLTALTFHSYVEVTRVDLGFDASGLVAVRMPRGDGLTSGDAKARLARSRELVAETEARLRELPGVEAVAGAHFWPMQPGGLRQDALPSRSDVRRYPTPGRYCVITPGFPAVLGVPLLAGREPTEPELAAAGGLSLGEQLAFANLTLARLLEQFGPPVGQVVGGRFRIVGVIPDVQLESPERPVEPTVFHLLPPPGAPAVLLLRLAPGRSIEDVGIRAVLSRIWGTQASRPFLVDDAVRVASAEPRARSFLLGLVSVLTIPLAMLGVVGALTFAIRQRTRDIAIHLAIGADPRQIRRRVVRQALGSAAIALAAGLTAGVLVGRLMRAALFGVTAVDPSAMVAAIGCVVAAVWCAAVIPARHASRTDPVQALREG